MNRSKRIKIALLVGSGLIFLASLLILRTKEISLNFGNIFVNEPSQVLQVEESLNPIADTFIRKEYPNKNYEGLPEIVSDGNPSVNALLRFDLSNINLDDVQSIELSVSPIISRKVQKNINLITSSWNSTTVTWNTGPAYGAVLGKIEAEVKAGVTEKYALDLNQIRSAGNILNIAIIDQDRGYSLNFSSLESGTPGVKLIITMDNDLTAIPEQTDPIEETPITPEEPENTNEVPSDTENTNETPNSENPTDSEPTNPTEPNETEEPANTNEPNESETPNNSNNPTSENPQDPSTNNPNTNEPDNSNQLSNQNNNNTTNSNNTTNTNNSSTTNNPVTTVDPKNPEAQVLTTSSPLNPVIVMLPPTQLTAPVNVGFMGSESTTASNATITNYTWTIDNDKVYSEKNINHLFEIPGEYEVKLVVQDSLNRTAEISKSVIVNSPQNVIVPKVISALPIGELIYSVSSVNLSVRTDAESTCKFSKKSDFNYNTTGTIFANTGSKHHKHLLNDLTPGSRHTYYVKCKTSSDGVTPTARTIEFTVSPTPAEAEVTLQSPYGVYPNCIAPGVPVESQQWWNEASASNNLFTDSSRLHVGMCAPNARDITDSKYFGGIQDFVAVVVMHNNPAKLTWLGAGFQTNKSGKYFTRTLTENGSRTTDWATQQTECEGGNTSCVVYKEPISCDGLMCTYQVPIRVDMSTCSIDGLCELRIRSNLSELSQANDKAFSTLNFQINTGGEERFNTSTAPIGKGWSPNSDYSSVLVDNYMNLFNGDYSKSIPTVSGVLNLKTKHFEAGISSSASFRLDPSISGVGGTLLYENEFIETLSVDDLSLDTSKLTNGLHTLFLTTVENSGSGKNTGALKLFINVQN